MQCQKEKVGKEKKNAKENKGIILGTALIFQ